MRFTLPTYTPPDFSSEALADAPNAGIAVVERDTVAPEGYHATSIFPEYFKVGGRWLLAARSRMDCVAVLGGDGEQGAGRSPALIEIREFRRLRAGDRVILGRTEDGSEGVLVHPYGFAKLESRRDDAFAFRQGRSRESSFSLDYDRLYELLRHEREHGSIAWVLGPASSFDADSREALAGLIRKGYANSLLAGNALATHDLEGSYRGTALGQNIYTQELQPNGHYNHIDTINMARRWGSIPAFIKGEGIREGILHACVERGVNVVLTGSIRDDGPLPGVIADVYEGQDAMRAELSRATTVIAMATALHTIASGNMTPCYHVLPDGAVRPVFFYVVDISEFTANKLADRGSLSAKSIITNVQDFVVNLNKNLD
ncbi:MAG: hypothetical protein LBS72_00995 [Oscillospiraceae bacterium]|jgi:hypothetical protein|nr:hypothetical protein [Oscillospiraceae bacterium]